MFHKKQKYGSGWFITPFSYGTCIRDSPLALTGASWRHWKSPENVGPSTIDNLSWHHPDVLRGTRGVVCGRLRVVSSERTWEILGS